MERGSLPANDKSVVIRPIEVAAGSQGKDWGLLYTVGKGEAQAQLLGQARVHVGQKLSRAAGGVVGGGDQHDAMVGEEPAREGLYGEASAV